jgi:carbonic anhydrase/acetyltransferase-like protein (isoleucine patch superfamily)
MKYKLLEPKNENGFYQIQAVSDFGNISAGTSGGWIQSEKNLSQEKLAWIYENASVYGNAKVSGDAKVSGNAQVHGDAHVSGNAQVHGDAHVSGNAGIYGNAQVHGNAGIYGNAQVHGDAHISGNAGIYENAEVRGNARVVGDAIVSRRHLIMYGKTTFDCSVNLKGLIENSTNLPVIDDKITAYKIVEKVKDKFVSLYDRNFEYKLGEITCPDYDPDKNVSCGRGIHVSNYHYWTNEIKDDINMVYLQVEVDINDVICCQEGKLRCKKVKVLKILNP